MATHSDVQTLVMGKSLIKWPI